MNDNEFEKIVISTEDLENANLDGIKEIKEYFKHLMPKVVHEEENKKVFKILKRLKLTESNIKANSIKWNSENNSNLIYGNITKLGFFDLLFRRFKKLEIYILIVTYINEEFRLIIFDGQKVVGMYKIEDIDEFLEHIAIDVINEFINPKALHILEDLIKLFNIFPCDGRIIIENDKLKFLDYVFKESEV